MFLADDLGWDGPLGRPFFMVSFFALYPVL
jgi:hypothetical protein